MKLSAIGMYKVLYTCIFSLLHAQPKAPIRLIPMFQFPPFPKTKPSLSNTWVNIFKALKSQSKRSMVRYFFPIKFLA